MPNHFSWACRFHRHFSARERLFEPEDMLPDPDTGETLSEDCFEIEVQDILPEVLQCSLQSFAERLAEARACGDLHAETSLQGQQQAMPNQKPKLLGTVRASSYAGRPCGISLSRPALCRRPPQPGRTYHPRRMPAHPLMTSLSLACRSKGLHGRLA